MKGWRTFGIVLLVIGLVAGLASFGDCGESARVHNRASTRAEEMAAYFGRPLNEVVTLRDQGYGYAEISKTLVISRMSRQPVAALIARHQEGYGWGTISRELGLDAIHVKQSVDQARRDLGLEAHSQERKIK